MKADQELVTEAKEGAVHAFSILVKRHQKAILRMALRMTRDLGMAEDIAQDTFIKAFQKLDTFEGRASFRSWLFQIAINTAKNKLRGKSREFVDISKLKIAVGSEAEQGLAWASLRHILQREIAELPPKQQEALSLRIFEDLSFKEIAEVMECPYDTAKANYRHALMKLRHRFEESKELKILKGLDSMLNAPVSDQQQIYAEVEG